MENDAISSDEKGLMFKLLEREDCCEMRKRYPDATFMTAIFTKRVPAYSRAKLIRHP